MQNASGLVFIQKLMQNCRDWPPIKTVVFSFLYCIVLGIIWWVSASAMLVGVIAFLPLWIYITFVSPSFVCLLFMVFSYFRIQEAFTFLLPYHIPELLGISIVVVLFTYILTGQIHLYWDRQLTIFTTFFALLTVDIIFSTNRAHSLNFWTGNFSKIAFALFALAWFVRSEADFKLAVRLIVLAGLTIGLVALYNKYNGIGLVEGTRVTIGRDIPSLLGDPNDLSLVLLFPASFALALTLNQGSSWFWRGVGAVTFTVILFAIVATESRGGLLGFVAVIAFFIKQKIKSMVFFVGIIVASMVILASMAQLSERVSGGAAEKGIDESSQGRLYAWQAGFRMAVHRPLTGVGLDTFVDNYYSYTPVWTAHNLAVHSTWFGVLAETGFAGFFIFIALVFLALKKSYQTAALLLKRKKAREKYSDTLLISAQGIFAGLVGFCVSGTFLTQAFNWPLYIMLGLSLALQHTLKQGSPD